MGERRTMEWGRSDDAWSCPEDTSMQLASAAELLRLMTDQAEDAFCETWSDLTSPELWRAVLDAESQPVERDGWGYDQTPRDVAFDLRRLALEAGCWWIWVRDATSNGVRMVPLSEWSAEHGALRSDASLGSTQPTDADPAIARKQGEPGAEASVKGDRK